MSFTFSFADLDSDLKVTESVVAPITVYESKHELVDIPSDEIVFDSICPQTNAGIGNIRISDELQVSYVLNNDPQEYGNYDIVKGKYEGGGKIWECSIDLAKYVYSRFTSSNSSCSSFSSYRPGLCLELGCGHGIPGLVALRLEYQVYFTDFNKEVLRVTHENVLLNNNNYNDNSNSNDKSHLCSSDAFSSHERYFYGDWLSLSDHKLKDL
jgi:tRNA G26 N,N-dimethylase Trm1